MAKPFTPVSPPEKYQEFTLRSWKEIAAYLKCSVSTAQRWEKREGLPVRRHIHEKLGSAQARASEIDLWRQQRSAGVKRRPASRAPESSTRRSKPMLAVLPFENLGGGHEEEYFSDGLTEELITELGRLYAGAMGVIARTSVMRYKAGKRSLDRVRRDLGVDYVLEGSVRRAGQRVRVAAQLIQASDRTHLWAEAYERPIDDLLGVQVDIARAVAERVGIELTYQDGSPTPRHRVADAYEYYLKGRFHWYKLSKVHCQTAIDYFQLALDRDPDYAAAYAGIAAVWAVRGDCGFTPPAQAYADALAAAKEAARLDNTLAEVHDVIGRIALYWDWTFDTAERAFLRSIQLNPSSADARLMYWDCLISQGRREEAEARMALCLELDPYNAFFHCFHGWHLLYVGRYLEAIEELEKSLKGDPELEAAQLGIWGALFRRGADERAILAAARFFRSRGDEAIAEPLVADYRRYGYAGAMNRAADRLATLANGRYVGALRVARLYAHGGDRTRALDWLEAAFRQREPGIVHMLASWDWIELRTEPRFRALVEQLSRSQKPDDSGAIAVP